MSQSPIATNHGPGKVCDQNAQDILKLYAEGKSSGMISRELGINASTLRTWLAGGCGEVWSDRLARARRAAALFRVEEAGEILDAVDPEGKSGSARVSKAREQVNHRRWLASKLDQAVWGDHIDVSMSAFLHVSGSLGGPLALASARLASRDEGDDTDEPLELDPGEPVDVEWTDEGEE